MWKQTKNRSANRVRFSWSKGKRAAAAAAGSLSECFWDGEVILRTVLCRLWYSARSGETFTFVDLNESYALDGHYGSGLLSLIGRCLVILLD